MHMNHYHCAGDGGGLGKDFNLSSVSSGSHSLPKWLMLCYMHGCRTDDSKLKHIMIAHMRLLWVHKCLMSNVSPNKHIFMHILNKQKNRPSFVATRTACVLLRHDNSVNWHMKIMLLE